MNHRLKLSKSSKRSYKLTPQKNLTFPKAYTPLVARMLYSTSSIRPRLDIPRKNIHISRTPCEQHAEIVMELLNSKEKPHILNVFSPPLTIISSRRDDIYNSFSRTYLISTTTKNHIPLKFSKLKQYRVKIVGKLISILASLHSIGILAGDTTVENIALKNNIQPIFRSAGQMRAMNAMGEGVSELIYLLCDLMRTKIVVSKELIHFIRHYLSSNKEAYLHAKYYLHSQKTKNKKPDLALLECTERYYSKYFC